jgi:hypothetical protein
MFSSANRHFSKEDRHLNNMDMEECSGLLIIREKQIKITGAIPLTPVRMTIIKLMKIMVRR